MEWSEDGIILTIRPHGETSTVLEALTATHGRWIGLVRGGRSKRQRPTLQPGNLVALTWKARLSGQLGSFSVDPIHLRAAELMDSPVGLFGLQHLAALLRLVPEREAHPQIYAALGLILDNLRDPIIAGPLLVRFEIALLDELGFGLDLSQCAVTGRTWDLPWVSPRSGRAVSREAGEPYRDRLLPLPAFLRQGERQPGTEINFRDISEGFTLSAYFFDKLTRDTQIASERLGEALPRTRAAVMQHLKQAYEQAGLTGLPYA